MEHNRKTMLYTMTTIPTIEKTINTILYSLCTSLFFCSFIVFCIVSVVSIVDFIFFLKSTIDTMYKKWIQWQNNGLNELFQTRNDCYILLLLFFTLYSLCPICPFFPSLCPFFLHCVVSEVYNDKTIVRQWRQWTIFRRIRVKMEIMKDFLDDGHKGHNVLKKELKMA